MIRLSKELSHIMYLEKNPDTEIRFLLTMFTGIIKTNDDLLSTEQNSHMNTDYSKFDYHYDTQNYWNTVLDIV